MFDRSQFSSDLGVVGEHRAVSELQEDHPHLVAMQSNSNEWHHNSLVHNNNHISEEII